MGLDAELAMEVFRRGGGGGAGLRVVLGRSPAII